MKRESTLKTNFARLFLLFMVYSATITSLAYPRKTELLNREWRYCIGDHTEARNATFDDSSWDTVGLPHSFSIPYFLSKDFYVGYGWYRKSIYIEKLKDVNVFLEFDGVFQDTEVYVNGQLADSTEADTRHSA